MDLKILSTTVNDVYLSPQVRSENETPEDAEPVTVQVIIQLSIPAGHNPPSKLLNLTASLVGYESIGFPKGGFEQNQPYYNKKTIESATDLKLESGSIYQFEVSFSVDHSTAPYQRCKYGRHHQKVQVKATFPGLLGKKTLVAEKNMFFIQTVAATGFLPYYHVHRGAEEGLGPVFLGVRTQHLTVGGYLRITFSLDSPSPTLQLHSLKLALLQQTTLKSRVRRNYMEFPPSERFVFFEAGPEELKQCLQQSSHDGRLDGLLALAQEQQQQQQRQEAGGSSHPSAYSALKVGQCNWVARIPNDSEARASTLPGSDCAIGMAHALELTIQYSDPALGNSDVRTYRSSWGLILPSCACRWQSMRLPSYTPEDANPVPKVSRDFWAGRNEHESVDQCVCGEELSHLLEMEQQAASESEIQASSELWRDMLSHRLQQRLLRNGFGARSSSSSPAISRIVSRRGSIDEPSASAASASGTAERGRPTRTPPSRSNSANVAADDAASLGEGVRFGLIEADDEIEFEMQAREVLHDLHLDEADYQREWDRLNDLRMRRNKARNEYTSVPSHAAQERRHRSLSANPALRLFQKRSASSNPSRANSRPSTPPSPHVQLEGLDELRLDEKE
ncbi:uncharacterized protein PAN0_003d2086 [Moesziomyces antarcticus]|uniref:Arrestin-like N-terminal domain-containing protein n=1 Tax=Pseudozyma antarctica TaxID=84753 RepID=A0A5C3FL16_PSEA2|nr:uncharacterized protein PAN0_003d2086 [Moesziomyces antarcticus]GAK63877.1 conserved hypothetical protein [Moesziomyces antarcticus]SPO44485.1 uncharacterized protein PSANT_02170 [Moesziomyces antarcticus]